jgi:hypothetical protein
MRAVFFIFIILCVTVSCKKKEIVVEPEELISTEMKPGLPEKPGEINGYLYSAYVKYAGNNYWYFINYSTFSDPPKNIMDGFSRFYDQLNYLGPKYYGNVDVGLVNANNLLLSKNSFSPNFTYSGSQQTYFIPEGTSCRWNTEGNRSFKPMEVNTLRTYPGLTVSATPSVVSKSSGITINLEGIASNYDSLVVFIMDQSSSYSVIKKPVGPDVKSVTFKPSDFSIFSSSFVYGALGFHAYNYCHQVIDNRLYVFEMGNKLSRNITIEP